jgi:MYXO-CTERM domain-containing protein
VPPDASDGRWLWALALALVFAEGGVRRRQRERAIEELHVDAA